MGGAVTLQWRCCGGGRCCHGRAMAADFNEPCACLPLSLMELLTHRTLILVGPCRCYSDERWPRT
ncbi:hypothetical protein ACLOJK_000916 [Asimina triloba]